MDPLDWKQGPGVDPGTWTAAAEDGGGFSLRFDVRPDEACDCDDCRHCAPDCDHAAGTVTAQAWLRGILLGEAVQRGVHFERYEPGEDVSEVAAILASAALGHATGALRNLAGAASAIGAIWA